VKLRLVVFATIIGAGGEKTQPRGTVLEDVVVDEVEEVSLLELVVETTALEDVVVDEVEVVVVVVELVE
jgi:hypothetical protein